MPPKKKQKTGNADSAPTCENEPSEASSSTPHKNDKKGRDVMKIPPHEYICINTPMFDAQAKERSEDTTSSHESEDEAEEDSFENYQKQIAKEEACGKVFEPAAEHKEWKWITLWKGWQMFCDFKRRGKYCNPDLFDMHICNDWLAWGHQELAENFIVAFNKEFKTKMDEDTMFEMWAVLGGMALWLGAGNGNDFIMSDDGDRVCAFTALMGYALLSALAAIEDHGELKSDSKFLDLPLVITQFLKWAENIEDYGIEGDAIAWRPYVVDYFISGDLDSSKGVTGTAKLLEKMKKKKEYTNRGEYKIDKGTKSSPWSWAKKLREYKKSYGKGNKIGGFEYDITRMSRKERAKHNFDNVDPLKQFSDKDLREGCLDIA